MVAAVHVGEDGGPGDAVPQPMILSFWVLVGLGILGLPQTSQKCMGYKDSRSMHDAMIMGTLIIGFLLLCVHLAGTLGRAVIPDLPAGDLAMPTLIMKLLSPFWAGVFIAGPLAAIMSTVDSMLLLASAAIIKDLYIHYGLKGDASRMTPARLQTMSLVCTAVIGLIVFAAAIEPPDLLVWINLFAFGGLEAVFLWPIILGLYWKEANASGAVASIVAGVAEGCVQADCSLVGGETAEHPGMMPEDEYDLAGFTVGVVDKEKILSNESMTAGDVIIALPSTGVHSNGFSLVRKIFDIDNDPDVLHTTPAELGGKTLGDALLAPTKIYVKPVLKVLEEVDVKGISHITGGGFYENIPRSLKKGCCARIKKDDVRTPALFHLMQKVGGISEHDMFNTFNMGVGMVLTVPAEQADKALEILHANGEPEAYKLGVIAEGDGVELC